MTAGGSQGAGCNRRVYGHVQSRAEGRAEQVVTARLGRGGAYNMSIGSAPERVCLCIAHVKSYSAAYLPTSAQII
jgi:hypothetical protein